MKDTINGHFLASRMREYDGSLFFCCSRSDKERILAFRSAARLLGISAREGKAVCAAIGPEELAKRPGRDALFVWPCMENLEIVEERTILIRPEHSLSPWAETLTGITNQDLEAAGPLETALEQLETVNQSGCFLLLDRGFTLPFLENAYCRYGIDFHLNCLPLDHLTEQLELSGRKKVSKLLESLPPLPSSWPYVPPKDRELEKLYRLTLALFYQWEAAA